MAPLIALATVTALLLLVRRHWSVALRGGLAAMFTLTGVAHFVGLRDELIAMVPPALPTPALLVTATGVLELLGAAALLRRETAPWSAAGLTALLVAMFPANVHAAQQGLSPSFGDQLVPRTALQVVFLAATIAVVVHHVRERRKGTRPAAPGSASPSVQ